MKEIKYPTLDEALYLHKILIERFGGTSSVLDLGLLESALARPRSGYYKTLSEQAAALMHSLAKNHSFSDGNKRMALSLTSVFLLMNGYRLDLSTNEAEDLIIKLATGSMDSVSDIADCLEKSMKRIKLKT